MRKNRHNNGYIGNDNIASEFNGTISPSNVQITFADKVQDIALPSDKYPTNGGGNGASASAVLGTSRLESIVIGGDCGSNYTTTTVLFMIEGAGGPTAYGEVVTVSSGIPTRIDLWRSVTDIVVTDSGADYITTPNVTISAPGNGAGTGVGSISGNTLTMTSVSSGYFFPGQRISGTGITFETTILNFGSGRGTTGTYVVNKTQTTSSVTVTGTATATAVAIMSGGKVAGVSLTYGGARYRTYPTATITTNFIASASASPVLSTFEGYTGGITITQLNPVSGSGSTAAGSTFAAILSYPLTGITVSSSGSGYTQPPTVLVGGAEDFIVTEATLSSQTISSISLNDPRDIRYIYNPNVTIGGWKQMPTVSEGEDKFVGTYAIFDGDNYVAFKCSGTYDVDWGDGTTGTFNSGATAQKQYTSSTYTGITSDAFYGYKTLNIVATPVSGARLTSVNLNVRHSSLSSSSLHSQWLSVKIAGNTLNSLTISGFSTNISYRFLQQFEFVGSPGNLTSGYGMFMGVPLKRFVGGELTKNMTSMDYMFYFCTDLPEISPLNTSKVTSMFSTFGTCRSLVAAPIMNTSLVTTTDQMFYDCTNLQTIPLYDLGKVTSASSMFSNCRRLQRVPAFDLRSCATIGSMFSNCSDLVEVPYMNTTRVTSFASTFSGCGSLKTIPKFKTSNVTTMESTFSGCYSLEEIPELDTRNVTSMYNTFSNCNSLSKIPNLDTKTVSNFALTFSNSGLKEFPSLDFREALDLSSCFSGCLLTEVPDIIAPKATTAASMFFNNYWLRRVGTLVLPLCTSFSNMFQNSICMEYPPQIVTGLHLSSITFNGIFNQSGLRSLPLFNTTISKRRNLTQTYTSMFSSLTGVSEIPEYDFSGSTGSSNTSTFSSIFSGMPALRRIKATGFAQSFVLPNPNMMGASALNELYTNLATVGASGAGAKTLTVTGSLGTAGDNIVIATSKGWTVTG